MKQIDRIKKDIAEITDTREMVAYLSAIEGHAGYWCKINQPEEVIFENGKLEEISLYGFTDFLNIEVEVMINSSRMFLYFQKDAIILFASFYKC